MKSAVAVPETRPALKETEYEEHGRLYHVVLLDDDEHTYDYVIEMLQKLFFMAVETRCGTRLKWTAQAAPW